MAMRAEELLKWIEGVIDYYNEDELIAIDEGGLTLVVNNDSQIYCEVGGIRESEVE